MSNERHMNEGLQQRRNRRIGIACFSVFVTMVGAAYAAVPLYDLFCRVTGYGGTTQVAEAASETVIDRMITIRFDANVNKALDWTFKPAQKAVSLRMGESAQVSYLALNDGPLPSTGTSVFNVTPNEAGIYFNKLDCFCFTEQEIQPGETIDMPVVFFVDPEMNQDPNLAHVKEITLSYTFFPVETPVKPVAARVDAQAVQDKL